MGTIVAQFVEQTAQVLALDGGGVERDEEVVTRLTQLTHAR